MSAEWKPGDVAMISALNKPKPYRAYFDGKTWREYDGAMFCVDSPTIHRPLVVIDPEDDAQVNHLARLVGERTQLGQIPTNKTLQAALRSLVEPERPAEPIGLGAVVEDEDGQRWVRAGRSHDGRLEDNWRGVDGGIHSGWWAKYADIKAVRVLSEGVTP